MSSSVIHLSADADVFLRQTLEKEILRSEERRLVLVLGFLVAAFGSFIGATFVPGIIEETTRQNFRLQAPQVFSLFAVAIAYEAALLALVKKRLREGRQLPHWARYVNSFLETSLTTVTLLIASTVFGPVQTLAAAPTRF